MWTFALRESDLRHSGVTRAYPAGLAVLIISRPGSLHALSSNCPHMGCSMGGAIIEGDNLQCPCHDWQFSIDTGKLVSSPEIGLDRFDAKIENGNVFVNI
jgi:3-phenylpropionate/trans-cinnamate dioxygenase ferredoxin subunit